MYTACKPRGFVSISYFDLRAATLAKHTLQGQLLHTQRLDVHEKAAWMLRSLLEE